MFRRHSAYQNDKEQSSGKVSLLSKQGPAFGTTGKHTSGYHLWGKAGDVVNLRFLILMGMTVKVIEATWHSLIVKNKVGAM